MSSIAKIFIVVNLLLSALALGWASTHLGVADDWKQQHATLKTEMEAQLADKESMISDLRNQTSTLEQSRETVRSEKDTAEAMRDRNATDLQSAQAEVSQLQASFSAIDGKLGVLAETNDNLQARFEQAANERSAAEEARREAEQAAEEAMAERADFETQLNAANDELASLMTAKTDLENKLQQAETQVAMLVEATGTTAGDIIIQPLIEGAVLNVNNSLTPGLVAINKGSADQVKRGFTFEIWNGGVYKGKARVETVQDNMCVATILATFNGAQITQGDRAATRL